MTNVQGLEHTSNTCILEFLSLMDKNFFVLNDFAIFQGQHKKDK